MLTLWPRSLVPSVLLDGPIRLDAQLPHGQHVYVPLGGAALHIEGVRAAVKPAGRGEWRPEGGPRGWRP